MISNLFRGISSCLVDAHLILNWVDGRQEAAARLRVDGDGGGPLERCALFAIVFILQERLPSMRQQSQVVHFDL